MKRLFFPLPIAVFIAFLVFPNFSLPTNTRGLRVTTMPGLSTYLYKDYHALVIGISNYEKWPKLPNAVKDAREVAAKLQEMGFQVNLLLDPSSSEMKNAFNDVVYDVGREENRAILVYFAGHGETEVLADRTHLGYIIPRDSPLLKKAPKGFASLAISMKDIESVSLRIRSKHVIMLFDSCFSGSIFTLSRAAPADISEKSALPVRQFITAGSEDEQVPDKSMFKRVFLIGLDGDADLTGDGYITGSELGMYLTDKVVNYTHGMQHPQYGKINNPDLDRGDFIFMPLKANQKKRAKKSESQREGVTVAEELPTQTYQSREKLNWAWEDRKRDAAWKDPKGKGVVPKRKDPEEDARREVPEKIVGDQSRLTIASKGRTRRLKDQTDSLAPQSLLRQKSYPRLMILFNKEAQKDFIAEQSMVEFFQSKGFSVIDSNILRKYLGHDELEALSKDKNVRRQLGHLYGAEILLAGNVETASHSAKIAGVEVHTNRAMITAKVIKGETGEIMASGSEEHRLPGMKGNIKEPVETASLNLAERLMKKIVKWWQRELTNTVNIVLVVEGLASYGEVNQVKSLLSNEVRGVEEVILRYFEEGQLELGVRLRGKVGFLANDLINFQLNGRSFFIKSEKPNMLVVHLK
ncbi:MAG: caspase family protein [Desulfatiglandales bacterium]